MDESVERRRKERTLTGDVGLGLVEIMIAMLLLGIISMAMLPLLMQGLRLTAKTATITTASQLVSQDINVARGTATSCASLANYSRIPSTTITDDAGRVFTTTRTAISCPTSFPAIVSLHVAVTSGGVELSSATTSILVRAA